MQILTLFLQNYAAERAEVEAHAGVVVRHYFEASYDSSRDAGARALIRARMWDEAASGQASIRAANRVRFAVRTIGKDHAVLAKNAEQLTSAKVLAALKTDAPEIEAALKPFL